MKCPCCNEDVKPEDVPHMCKKEAKGSKSALSDGAYRLPIEAIDVENEWQSAQGHIEDGDIGNALYFIGEMKDKIDILRKKLSRQI